MNIEALLCARCGGPLSRPPALPALIDCLFCGAVISVRTQGAVISSEGKPDEVRRHSREQFVAVLEASLQAGTAPLRALRDASAAHLGVAGQSDVVARITIALASDFERECGIAVLRDSRVLARIAEAYLKTLGELATESSVEMNLPFLTADARGPRHLLRRLTAQDLAALALRDPDAPPPPPEPAPVAAPATAPEPAKKKRGWWPF